MPETEPQINIRCSESCEWLKKLRFASHFYGTHPSTQGAPAELLLSKANKLKPEHSICAGRVILNSVSGELQFECLGAPDAQIHDIAADSDTSGPPPIEMP